MLGSYGDFGRALKNKTLKFLKKMQKLQIHLGM
jgi:hypothetical protein